MSLFDRLNARPFRPSKQKSGALIIGALAIMLTTNAASASSGFQSVFDCGDVIGKVFDDKNGNGVQDDGEHGFPGVRLVSARGLLTVTDDKGRYHVTCAQLPSRSIGSIFLLKVDTRSLPTGHRITTKNPRTVRLTHGKVSKMNFGASAVRVVRLDLAGAAFEPSSTELDAQWSAGIDQLLAVLDEDHSVLRVVYQKGAEDKALANKRMKAVSRLVEERWQQRESGYHLEIDRRMVVGH